MYIHNKYQNKFKVCNVIRKLLMQDETINLLVGNRIFPVINIEGAGDGPFIIYQRESYRHQATKQGIYEEIADIFIACISSDYDESQAIAEAVYLCLQDFGKFIDEDTNTVINSIDLLDSIEDYAADKYIQVLKFEVK